MTDPSMAGSRAFTLEVCIDCREPALVAAFWSSLLGYRVDGDVTARWVHLGPPSDGFPVLNLQRVPEVKQVKNRLHLDLFVADPQPWIDRAVELGASTISLHDHEDDWFQVLADPEGNEFCVCRENQPPP